ncbi:hypothetical protein NOF04DRAFT_1270249 [Fusarium oxysporum II5]|nr:hypothetical protein NOF04DRAFT_1270249 [Fusarium oxysporum II5]
MCCFGRSKRRKGRPSATAPMRSAPTFRTPNYSRKPTATQMQWDGTISPRSAGPKSANKAWDQSFFGASNGFRKGKSRQTASQGSDTSRRGINGSYESFQGNSWR